jgi:thiamine pyrophosphokinase
MNQVAKSLTSKMFNLRKVSENTTLVLLRDMMADQARDKNILPYFMNSSTNIICCDGGINRLLYNEEHIQPNTMLLHCGDFDSVPNLVTDSEINRWGVVYKVKILNKDQDHSDLEKGLNYFLDERILAKFNPCNDIVVHGITGSRFDHSMNNLSC